MKKEKLLHSTKIQQMIAQYKHDMQLVDQLTTDAEPHYEIEQELYKKYEVKRGLRDLDGKGVRAGLTTISKVSATQIVDGREVPAAGQLLYRGIPIEQLVQDGIRSKIASISQESQLKLQDTMQKIVNDSKGGIVCIII